tara:strand:+ start:321 stop:839 length:519 start_codon:yes stop_codon:yes gene_type:complete
MGQEFIIKSQKLEDKINQLLPSQGGFQAGVDLSASTTVIPIVDLTESAEGSDVRADIQTAFSHNNLTTNVITNQTNAVLVNTTGYYRVFAYGRVDSLLGLMEINLFDGATSKTLFQWNISAFANANAQLIDIVVFLQAGDSLRGTSASTGTNDFLRVVTRQIADISGNLINP